MKRISAADAFGLSLIRQNPNPKNPEVKRIIRSFTPDLQKAAKRILARAKKSEKT